MSSPALPDTVEHFEKFWKPIVCDKRGKLLRNEVMKELHDYSTIMDAASKVYDEVTGGKVSKPNTRADAVISLATDFQNELWAEVLKEEKEQWLNEYESKKDEEIRLLKKELSILEEYYTDSILAIRAKWNEVNRASDMLVEHLEKDLEQVTGERAESDAEVGWMKKSMKAVVRMFWRMIP